MADNTSCRPSGKEDGVSAEQQPLIGSGTASLRPRPRRYASLSVILFFGFVNSVCVFLLTPFYPQIAAKKKGSAADTEVGIVIGVECLCAFLGSIFLGPRVNKFGVKFLIISGSFLIGGGTILFAFVGDIDEWTWFLVLSVAIRCVMGFGEASAMTTSSAVVLTLFPNRLSLAWALFEMASIFGFIAGQPLGGALFSVYGFRFPFLVIGSLALITLPLLVWLVPQAEASESTELSLWQLLRMLPVMTTCLSVCWVCGAFALLNTSLAVYLDNEFGWGASRIGLVFLTAGVLYFVSALLFGTLADSFHPRAAILLGLLIVGVSFMLIGPSFLFPFLQAKSWLVFVSMALFGTGSAAVMVAAASDIIRCAVARGYQSDLSLNGAVSGLVVGTMYLSQALGAPIAGAVTVVSDFRHSTSYFAFLILGQLVWTSILTVLEKATWSPCAYRGQENG